MRGRDSSCDHRVGLARDDTAARGTNGRVGGGLGHINRDNILDRQLVAEQGTVRHRATAAAARRRGGGAVVVAVLLSMGAGGVCRYGNGVDGGRGSLGSW
jgi:hypothetical protein